MIPKRLVGSSAHSESWHEHSSVAIVMSLSACASYFLLFTPVIFRMCSEEKSHNIPGTKTAVSDSQFIIIVIDLS
jgi:hypothetical protein